MSLADPQCDGESLQGANCATIRARMNSGMEGDDTVSGSLSAPLDALPATTAQLPLEVWEHILDDLFDDREALQTSGLTCRAWVPKTRRLLFAKVELHSSAEITRFRCALETSEASEISIAPLVKSLALTGLPLCRLQVPYATRDTLLHGVCSKLCNVTSLHLEDVSFDIVLPLGSRFAVIRPFSEMFPFPSLRQLHLASVMFRSPHDFPRLVSAFPRLAVLKALRTVWPQHPDPTPSPFVTSNEQAQVDATSVTDLLVNAEPVRASFLQWTRTLLSVQRLEWSAYVVEYRRWVHKMLHDCAPHVKVLRLLGPSNTAALRYVDGRRYVQLENLTLALRMPPRGPPGEQEVGRYQALPSFLSGFVSGRLREIGLNLGIFDSVDQYQGCIDWRAFDDVLVRLHQRNHELSVTFLCHTRVLQTSPRGPSDLLEDFQARFASSLPDALQTKMTIDFALQLYSGAFSKSTLVGPVQISPAGSRPSLPEAQAK